MRSYILEGHDLREVSLTQWSDWFGNASTGTRSVAHDVVDGVHVWTSFLGFDPLDEGRVFVTEAFHATRCVHVARTRSWAEAEDAHCACVADLRGKLGR